MTEKLIDVSTLTSLDELLAQITSEADLILTRGTTPFARVTFIQYPPAQKKDRTPNLHPRVWISDEFDGFLPREFFDDKNGL